MKEMRKNIEDTCTLRSNIWVIEEPEEENLKQGQKNTKARAKDKIIIEEYIHEINTKIFKVRILFIPVNSDSE